MLADIAVNSTGIDKNLFKSQIGTKRTYTVSVWKFGVKSQLRISYTF